MPLPRKRKEIKMGFFGKIFRKEDTSAVETHNEININESKENLNKVLVNLSKESKVDLTKHTARVALATDYSGSMSGVFQDGSLQRTISRLLPIALKFDDNGELESWLFSNGYKSLAVITESNYENYVKNVMQKSGMGMGGTEYAPVLRDMIRYYKNVEPSKTPAFIIFITDGENEDKSRTDEAIRELSEYNIFVQFIGIGREKFEYLKKLDNLKGRKHDNTGFTAIEDMNKLNDEQLYTELLRQYKDWLNKK